MNEITNIRFRQQHEALIQQIDGLGDDFLRTPFDQKWSIFCNVAHLGRYQEVYEMRIHAMLTGHTPQFSRYEATHDSEWKAWQGLTTEQVLNKIKRKRRLLWDEISIFTIEQENMAGVHPKFGRMTISDWTEFFLLHEAHHVYRIFRIIHEYKAK